MDVRQIEQRVSLWQRALWRYIENPQFEFDRSLFDTSALRRQGLVRGSAAAGRGNTVFFSVNNQPLVLRHYYRGGLVRHLSKQHYIYTGMGRTRALREFDMLVHLHGSSLPAPQPYACRVQRHGVMYQASLITHRLPGSTLSERLLTQADASAQGPLSDNIWQAIGSAIARFHQAGVYHADLNAHNVMLDDERGVMLIDFDRSRVRPLPLQPASAGWCLDNLQRLARSLTKLARHDSSGCLNEEAMRRGFDLCKTQWANELSATCR